MYIYTITMSLKKQNGKMNNWDIIEELVQSNWLVKQCFYITKDINSAKFYESEIILKLYELDKLVYLYKKNEHKMYIGRLIYNLITDKRKKNHYTYNIINTQCIEDYIKYNEDKDDE